MLLSTNPVSINKNLGKEAGIAFHAAVASATYNSYSIALLGFLRTCLTEAMGTCSRYSGRTADNMKLIRAECQTVLDAIRGRDGEAARNATRVHFVNAAARMGFGTIPI
jgi:GntR family transcriptional repressor for pyruvate dehydrogenase complex